jgi:hypothetical protein
VPLRRELARHFIELGDDWPKVGLVHDTGEAEVETNLTEELAEPFGPGIAGDLYVAELVELQGQAKPWLHRVEGSFLANSVVHLA